MLHTHITVAGGVHVKQCGLPYTDTMMDSTEGLKDGQSSILNECFFTTKQEKVILQNLEYMYTGKE